MADSGAVKAVSKLVWDNTSPILETLVNRGKVDVEYPNTKKGIKMAIDVVFILKELCYSFKDWNVDFHTSDDIISYHTGKSNDPHNWKLNFWPASYYSKKFKDAFYEIEIMQEDGLKPYGIEIRGQTIPIANVKMPEDWFLLKRLEDKAPKPFIKENMLNFKSPDYKKSLWAGLFYYNNPCKFEPRRHIISSKQEIFASKELYNFLQSSINFQLKRRYVC